MIFKASVYVCLFIYACLVSLFTCLPIPLHGQEEMVGEEGSVDVDMGDRAVEEVSREGSGEVDALTPTCTVQVINRVMQLHDNYVHNYICSQR